MPWGRTFVVSLAKGETLTIPAVAEDGVVFEREFRLAVGLVQTTAAVLVNPNGQVEYYLWRVTLTDPPFESVGVMLAMVKGMTARVTCNDGMVMVSWRERYAIEASSSLAL
jgi:hypothetical protein